MHDKFMKIEKKYYSWLFAVIVLSILLAISIILGISGWYFSNEKSKITDFKLGNSVEIFLNKNSAIVLAWILMEHL